MNNAFIPGFGATLAAARETMGLSAAEVADRLKLTARQVEALEAEDWPSLPDQVFVRGFVRNYAKLVGVDPDALINPVPAVQSTTQTITAPSAGLRLDKSPFTHWLVLPLLLLGLFVVVVAGLYAWLSQGEDAMLPAAATTPQSTGADHPAPPAVAPAAGKDTVVETLRVAPQTTDGTSAEKPVEAPGAAPADGGGAAAPVAPPGATQGEQSGPARASMRFEPQADAWIQVVDGKGERYSRLVRAGSSEVLTGTPPFRLVVGNAAEVKLIYNGHPIDLQPFIGEKVARLTLE